MTETCTHQDRFESGACINCGDGRSAVEQEMLHRATCISCQQPAVQTLSADLAQCQVCGALQS